MKPKIKGQYKKIRLTTRVDEFTQNRLNAVAEFLNVKKSRLLNYIIFAFLRGYDREVSGKYSPIPTDLLLDFFQVEKDYAKIKKSIQIINEREAQEKNKIKEQNLEVEIKDIFSECEEKGKELQFTDDIKKRF